MHVKLTDLPSPFTRLRLERRRSLHEHFGILRKGTAFPLIGRHSRMNFRFQIISDLGSQISNFKFQISNFKSEI